MAIEQNYPNLELVKKSGWNGSIAADDNLLYLASGTLKSGKNGKLTSKHGSRLWNGDISIYDGKIYIARSGKLYRGALVSGTIKANEQLGARGWTGSIAVSGHWIYLARNGELRRGDIRHNPIVTKSYAKRGWTGSIAIHKNQIYLATPGGQLRTANLPKSKKTVQIGNLSPNSEITVNANNLYVSSGNDLYKYKRIVPLKKPSQTQPGGLWKHASRVLRRETDSTVGRRSEGDFLSLGNKRLVFAYSRFSANSGDHCPSALGVIHSFDNGKSWVDDERLFLAEGNDSRTLMEVNLIRMDNNETGLAYLVKRSIHLDCGRNYSISLRFRYSSDEMRTWSEPIEISKGGVINNDRLIQLANGRLVLPVSWNGAVCYLSEDYGRSWRRMSGPNRKPRGGSAMEPGVVELSDGRVMLWTRTQLGHQYACYSSDGCENFTKFKKISDLKSPSSPASIKRIPGSSKLLCFWNKNFDSNSPHMGNRTPLNSAISDDGGLSWKSVKSIESSPDGYFAYTAIHFHGNEVLLGHAGGQGRAGGAGIGTIQITRVPLSKLRS